MTIAEVLGLMGGLALFLYGMHIMGTGLELMAGSRLKSILERLTRNRFLAMLVGLGLTAVIQSSNAMTVMTVGFVNAGLMDFPRAIGVIMGANIGTTVTGQLIALNINTIAPVFAFVGVILYLFCKKKRVQYIGLIFAGLGVLFMGMNMMSTSMAPLQHVQWFQDAVASLQNPILGVLAGAAFTLIIQSSSASVGVLQAMAMQGVIGLESAIFVICGQNIGCTIAAIMASFGGNKNAHRTALVHLLFNVTGTLIFLVATSFLPIVPWIESLTPGDGVQQIANAHTMFNIATTALLLPCAGLLEKIARLLIPGDDVVEGPRLMHIKDLSLSTVQLSMAEIDAEVQRMHALAHQNLETACSSLVNLSEIDMEALAEREHTIDFLNKEITRVLVRMHALELAERDAAHVSALYHVLKDIERIGDHAENIAGYAAFCYKEGTSFSAHAREGLAELSEKASRIMQDAYHHFIDPRDGKMPEIQALEQAIDDLVDALSAGHIERLNQHRCTAELGMLYVEVLTDLERVADHALNIAEAARGKYTE